MQNPKNKRKNGIIFKKNKKTWKIAKMKKICKIFKNLQKNMQKHEKKTHYGYIPKKSIKKK